MVCGCGRGVGQCLRSAVFVGVAFLVVAAGASRARAEGDGAISPFPSATGPVDSTLNYGESTPSADYVRKQTEPPRFDANSPAAKAARAAAPPPRPVAPPVTKGKPSTTETARHRPEVGGIAGDDSWPKPTPPPRASR